MRQGVTKTVMTLTDYIPFIIILLAVYIAGYLMGFCVAAGMNEQKGEEKDGGVQELPEENDRMS